MEVEKDINSKKYTVRDEPFGFTIYDHSNLTRRFFKKEELKPYLEENNIKDYIYLPAKHKEYRKDILYSPLRIYYETTLACNLHCKFCFNKSGEPRKNELTTEEVIASLYSLREDNVIDIRFTGGEITRRPDWYKILNTAKNLGFVVSCNTNATFTDPKIAEKLASLNLDQITISIDGTEKHHDKNRGTGNYKRALQNLELLHRLGAKLRINTLLTKLTINDLEPLLEATAKYINEINFFPVAFIGRGEGLESEYSMTLEEFYNFKLKADEAKKKYPHLNLLTFCEATRRTSVNVEEKDDLGLNIGTPTVTGNFNITSDGGLWSGGYIPYMDSYFEMGNIKIDSVFNIWQKSKKLKTLRREAQKLKEFCYKCKEYGRRCPGADFELEIYRQIKPGFKNYYCTYGEGEPLMNKLTKELPYRDNVAALIFKGNKYLLIQMIDWPDNFWKMPQGGVHDGENKEQALMRELKEELGSDNFKIIKQFPNKHQYDWDKESVKLAGFKWRGQKQSFFLVEFNGDKLKISKDELKDYCWVTKKELLKKIDIKDHPLFKGYKKLVEKLLK